MINILHELKTKIKPEITIEKGYKFAEEEAYTYCLIFRVIELTDGYINAFNNKNYLTALCSIRSCIETIVTAAQFKDQFKSILGKKSVHNLNNELTELRQKFVFGRGGKNLKLEKIACDILNLKGMDGTKTAATNTATHFNKHPEIKELYEILCEFVHPNCLGVYDFYIKEDNDLLLTIHQKSSFSLEINLIGIKSALCQFNNIYEELLEFYKLLRSGIEPLIEKTI